MNVTVIGQMGPVRTVTGVGCIEFGPGSAALLRNQQGGVLSTIVLGDGYSLAIGRRTVKAKATGRATRRQRADAERALRLRASQRMVPRSLGARRSGRLYPDPLDGAG
ncbi:MAG TPA: hypothetical protein VIA06_05160 [Candidatus Dormibacteraeota bacterium]|jgi:hypothetical protein|nr:hypothetical protein [Candidatus Dormibacteraeota bacterium]